MEQLLADATRLLRTSHDFELTESCPSCTSPSSNDSFGISHTNKGTLRSSGPRSSGPERAYKTRGDLRIAISMTSKHLVTWSLSLPGALKGSSSSTEALSMPAFTITHMSLWLMATSVPTRGCASSSLPRHLFDQLCKNLGVNIWQRTTVDGSNVRLLESRMEEAIAR